MIDDLDPHLPFGNVPDADPSAARIEAVQSVGADVIVTMTERQNPDSDVSEVMTYTLAIDKGAWKLTDRSVRLPTRELLHNLLWAQREPEVPPTTMCLPTAAPCISSENAQTHHHRS